MQGPRLKVKRANSHIKTIISDSATLSKKLYEITNGSGRSVALLAKPDSFLLTYRPKEPITTHFSPIIGDTVNNLREALDYWMNAAVKVVNSPKKLHFPFSKNLGDLEATNNYKEVHKAFPDAASFILNTIKPCWDTNPHLWAVTSLCNDNKHNDFIPTVTVTEIKNINAVIGSIKLENCTVSGDADSQINIGKSHAPITIENNFSTYVEIKFPKGAVFENQPVIPTLQKMSQVVSQTLDTLEDFIGPYMN